MDAPRVAADAVVPPTQGGTMFRHTRRALVACAATAVALAAPARRAGRRPERLERDRAEPRDHAPADGARPDARNRDGAGRGLRRRQRNRPRPQAVSPERRGTRGTAVGVGGRGHRHGGPPRARRARGAAAGGRRSTRRTRRRSTAFPTGWSSSKASAPARPPPRRCSPPGRTTGTSARSTSAS